MTAAIVLPVTRGQDWVLAGTSVRSPPPVIRVAAQVQGPLEVERLTAALDEVVGVHAPLRLRTCDGGWRLAHQVHVPIRRFSAREGDDPAQLRRRFYVRDSVEPFDLAAEGPVRARVLHFGAETHFVVLTLHHVAADAATRTLLEARLVEAYESTGSGRLPWDAEYQDAFEAWRLDQSDGPARFWSEVFAAAPPPSLCPCVADAATADAETARYVKGGRLLPFALPAVVTAAVEHAATTLCIQHQRVAVHTMLGLRARPAERRLLGSWVAPVVAPLHVGVDAPLDQVDRWFAGMAARILRHVRLPHERIRALAAASGALRASLPLHVDVRRRGPAGGVRSSGAGVSFEWVQPRPALHPQTPGWHVSVREQADDVAVEVTAPAVHARALAAAVADKVIVR